MYKLSETEVLAQPTEYVNESEYKVWNYKTGEGDGGFMDSFNALKYQIDFNYSQYNYYSVIQNQIEERNIQEAIKLSLIEKVFFLTLLIIYKSIKTLIIIK